MSGYDVPDVDDMLQGAKTVPATAYSLASLVSTGIVSSVLFHLPGGVDYDLASGISEISGMTGATVIVLAALIAGFVLNRERNGTDQIDTIAAVVTGLTIFAVEFVGPVSDAVASSPTLGVFAYLIGLVGYGLLVVR
ncbi:hypothetical protein ACFQE1_02160 [Halobium palmae]|uniref:Uncharacterized protein n=1 Tax=Halobium palmae TaxID=1776492 RepID=A0ABD5RVC2_9EURY